MRESIINCLVCFSPPPSFFFFFFSIIICSCSSSADNDDDDEDEEEEDGDYLGEVELNAEGRGAGQNAAAAVGGFDPEKLRVYELRKLKYFFAVVECSSVAAAEVIYRQASKLAAAPKI